MSARERPTRLTGLHPSRIFVLGDPPVYEPGVERSATAIAAGRGVDEWELLLELLLADGGRELLNAPVLNYTDGNLDAVGEMLRHPTSAFGLGDGGAHAGQTCDASTTTTPRDTATAFWSALYDRDWPRIGPDRVRPLKLCCRTGFSARLSMRFVTVRRAG